MNIKLAEYLGIHYGNGNLSKPINYTYKIAIALHLREKRCAHFIQQIFF